MHNTQFKKMVDSPSQHRDAKTKCIGVMLLIILLPLLYHFIQSSVDIVLLMKQSTAPVLPPLWRVCWGGEVGVSFDDTRTQVIADASVYWSIHNPNNVSLRLLVSSPVASCSGGWGASKTPPPKSITIPANDDILWEMSFQMASDHQDSFMIQAASNFLHTHPASCALSLDVKYTTSSSVVLSTSETNVTAVVHEVNFPSQAGVEGAAEGCGSCSSASSCVGRLLDGLGRQEQGELTLCVPSADHIGTNFHASNLEGQLVSGIEVAAGSSAMDLYATASLEGLSGSMQQITSVADNTISPVWPSVSCGRWLNVSKFQVIGIHLRDSDATLMSSAIDLGKLDDDDEIGSVVVHLRDFDRYVDSAVLPLQTLAVQGGGEVQVQVWWFSGVIVGTMQICVHELKGLAASLVDSPDPYVLVKLGGVFGEGESELVAQEEDDTTDAVWDGESACVSHSGFSRFHPVTFKAMNHNTYEKDTVIGIASVYPITDINYQGTSTYLNGDLPLTSGNEHKAMLSVEITWSAD